MNIDFGKLKLLDAAYEDRPMAFLKPEIKGLLGDLFSIAAIENADRRSRRRWQETQLRHLFAFATQRSAFWKQRLFAAMADKRLNLANIPVLQRSDVRQQVESGGALVTAADGLKPVPDSTSGSSGTPLTFFRTDFDEHYATTFTLFNAVRAQRDLTTNQTQLKTSSKKMPNGFIAQTADSWLGPMSGFAKSGLVKVIEYGRPDLRLLKKELLRHEIGNLISTPDVINELLQEGHPSFFRKAGMRMWIPIGGAPDDTQRQIFADLNIPIQAHYSSREAGSMGVECAVFPGHYHVNNSNVIIEIKNEGRLKLGKAEVGAVLMTRLHSYATPFIRYENGDVATLYDTCPCGHDGPTLSNLYGRQKNLIKHRDGTVSTFFVQVKNSPWLLDFDEFRFRQTAPGVLKIEVGGRESLTEDEIARFRTLVLNLAGPEFEMDIEAFLKLDWGGDTKRLGFRNEII